MATFHITLSESLHQFVAEQVAEKGLDHSDQYFAQLIEAEQRKNFDDYYMEKVQEAIDQNEWIAEKEFWQLVDEDTHTRRNARKLEAVS